MKKESVDGVAEYRNQQDAAMAAAVKVNVKAKRGRSRGPTLARESAGAVDRKDLPLYMRQALSRQRWCDDFLTS